MIATHTIKRDFRRLRHTAALSESVARLATPLLSALTICLLFLASQYNLPFPWIYRYLCVIPVTMAAYQYGWAPGLISSAFFSFAYIPQLYWIWRWNGLSLVSIELISFIIFLNILAYIVADMADSERTQEALTDAVRDGKALLARASNFDEVIAFTLQVASEVGNAETAALIMRNPLDHRWEIITLDQKQPAHIHQQASGEKTLAHWLVDQNRALVLDNLDEDTRFVVPHQLSSDVALRSLISRPLRQNDQSLLGILALINKRNDRFARSDMYALDELVTASERALEQAGLYAHTDRALTVRVQHLRAIQRTARELNATLEPQQIIDLALGCAVELADGDAGLVSVEMNGLPPMIQTWGCSPSAGYKQTVIEATTNVDRARLYSDDLVPTVPTLLDNVSSRLVAPIRRADTTVGVIIVESKRRHAFEHAIVQAVNSLTDHVMTALENARLFREIKREEERVNLIISSIADGIFTTDTQGYILTFNPAAAALTGWPATEAQGQSFCDLVGCNHGDSGDDTCPLTAAIQSEETIRNQKWIIRHRLGTKRVVSLSVTPISHLADQPAGAVVIFRDITEQEELDRLQREFVAAFSHELRTPLTKITTVAEMIAEENRDAHVEISPDYIDILMSQSRHVADFTEKILDVSRLEGQEGSLQARPLPMSLVIQDLLSEWQTVVSTHNFILNTPEQTPWAWADENAVQTIIKNLIDNAVKYSPSYTTIEVTISTTSSGWVTVSVQDQGVGILPDHQPRIFDRFYRVDGSDAQTVYGHGLGLYLSRTLVEAMGGEIWVESEVNTGSTFSFTLPPMKEEDNGSEIAGY